MKPLLASNLPGLPLLHRGKVRDVHAVDDRHVLIVATDRLSAFDVVLPDPIPGKGEILTQLSNFWFEKLAHLGPDHRSGIAVEDVLPAGVDSTIYSRRSVVARRLDVLPIEAVVRGYLIGSGWRDYLASGALCGIELPAGLVQADRLEAPVFTPATKAAAGDHDENISFARMVDVVGRETAEAVQTRALAMYAAACAHASPRGILIADTKFEFALDPDNGAVVLVDEALTPDSSRFWDAARWQPGSSPASYDKQAIRDHLDGLHWDKTPPGPRLPPAIIADTAARYRQVLDRLLS